MMSSILCRAWPSQIIEFGGKHLLYIMQRVLTCYKRIRRPSALVNGMYVSLNDFTLFNRTIHLGLSRLGKPVQAYAFRQRTSSSACLCRCL